MKKLTGEIESPIISVMQIHKIIKAQIKIARKIIIRNQYKKNRIKQSKDKGLSFATDVLKECYAFER